MPRKKKIVEEMAIASPIPFERSREPSNSIDLIESTKPSWKLKLFFWLILGAFSTVFAEVVTGSTLFPFFNLTGIFVIFPVYLAHIIVLATIVWRWGRANLFTLFLGGMLFGLYEAYLTKVLWYSYQGAATYGNPSLSVGGVAVFEFLLLVLFWHAFFGFILPLFFAEHALTSSRSVVNGFPGWMRRNIAARGTWILFALAIFFGFFQSNNAPSVEHALLSGLLNAAFLGVLIFLWRTWSHGTRYSLREFLPERRGFFIWLLVLAAIYIVGSSVINPDPLPAIPAQAMIWAVYAITFLLFVIELKKSKRESSSESISESNFSWQRYGVAAILFSLASVVGKLFLPPKGGLTFALIVFFVGALIGIVILARIVWRTLRRV